MVDVGAVTYISYHTCCALRRSSYTSCDAILLDPAVKGSNSGGTGAAFDWNVAKHCQEIGTGNGDLVW